MMKLKPFFLPLYYKIKHPRVSYTEIPYMYKRFVVGELWHLIRKGICQNIAPNCVLTSVRIGLYRICGFKIGKGTFIGMKCYLDDLCVDKIVIGNNVTISYGVYFACHGRKQDHNMIVIKDGAYIGMRAAITARHDIEIGENAVIGAMALVNKSISAGKTAVGVPCRVLNSLNVDCPNQSKSTNLLMYNQINMTEHDVIFKIYGIGDNPAPNCFCHFGWEGSGSFAFWKYACAYYDCAEILFERFKESKGNYAILDGIGLPICFSYRHFIELTLKYLFVKFVCTKEQEYKDYLDNNGHDLNGLWKGVKKKLSELKKRAGSTVNIGCVEHYIKEFDKFDKDSMKLRYPVNKKLEPMKPETRLDIYNLHDRMQELYLAFDALSYELDNQLFVDVDSDKLNKFAGKYEELHSKIETIINEIDSINDVVFESSNLLERLKNSETSKIYSILEDCSDDEIILLDTLYYTGRAIHSGELRLPKNPYEARTDVMKMCILNMQRDKLEFGKPKNEQINIYGKQKDVIVEYVRKAMEELNSVNRNNES